MKKKLYLAGAMGCYGNDIKKANEWRNRVLTYIELSPYNKENIRCFNPASYYNYSEQIHKTEQEIMRFDFNQLKNSDIVLVNLKDIDKSIGTSDEVLFSYLHGIPVIGFYEDSDNINFVHPWKIEQMDRIETGKDALKNVIDYILEYYS